MAPVATAAAAPTAAQQAAALLARKGLAADDRLSQTAAMERFDLEARHLSALQYEERENQEDPSFAKVCLRARGGMRLQATASHSKRDCGRRDISINMAAWWGIRLHLAVPNATPPALVCRMRRAGEAVPLRRPGGVRRPAQRAPGREPGAAHGERQEARASGQRRMQACFADHVHMRCQPLTQAAGSAVPSWGLRPAHPHTHPPGAGARGQEAARGGGQRADGRGARGQGGAPCAQDAGGAAVQVPGRVTQGHALQKKGDGRKAMDVFGLDYHALDRLPCVTKVGCWEAGAGGCVAQLLQGGCFGMLSCSAATSLWHGLVCDALTHCGHHICMYTHMRTTHVRSRTRATRASRP